MNNQNATGAIRLNLNHRLNSAGYEALNKDQLIDSIESITDRAHAVIAVLQSLCTAGDGESLREINKELVFFSLESIRMDVRDIAVIGSTLLKMR